MGAPKRIDKKDQAKPQLSTELQFFSLFTSAFKRPEISSPPSHERVGSPQRPGQAELLVPDHEVLRRVPPVSARRRAAPLLHLLELQGPVGRRQHQVQQPNAEHTSWRKTLSPPDMQHIWIAQVHSSLALCGGMERTGLPDPSRHVWTYKQRRSGT